MGLQLCTGLCRGLWKLWAAPPCLWSRSTGQGSFQHGLPSLTPRLCGFVFPLGGAEADATVVPAPASTQQPPPPSRHRGHQGSQLTAPFLAGQPRAMSNDPPPPYPGGPSAPLIEEKHGPPPATGTGGPSCCGVPGGSLLGGQEHGECGFPRKSWAVAVSLCTALDVQALGWLARCPALCHRIAQGRRSREQ